MRAPCRESGSVGEVCIQCKPSAFLTHKLIDYATPGRLTNLHDVSGHLLESIASDPIQICLPVHSLVIQPTDAEALGLPPERFNENQLRPASRLVQVLGVLDPSPLSVVREPGKRVIGTCRHFAVLSCALLRYRGVKARVRCGFATYFQPDKGLDHWITEYWDNPERRWVRIDAEILGQSVVNRPDDLDAGQFLTGSEAWAAYRRGEIDAATFGVYGTENWGAGEIRGNAVKDLAALNKVEMLPWDVWGRMFDAYKSQTGADYDELLDVLAGVCATDDPLAITALYHREEFVVPPDLVDTEGGTATSVADDDN
jgi:transglutaminase superfamily protein